VTTQHSCLSGRNPDVKKGARKIVACHKHARANATDVAVQTTHGIDDVRSRRQVLKHARQNFFTEGAALGPFPGRGEAILRAISVATSGPRSAQQTDRARRQGATTHTTREPKPRAFDHSVVCGTLN
jgi:hypothetical protein